MIRELRGAGFFVRIHHGESCLHGKKWIVKDCVILIMTGVKCPTMIKHFLLATLCAGRLFAQDAEFKPIFNGKDFDGWWGLGTEDPAKWMALAPEKLAEKKKKSLEDIKQHWKVVDGVLVNDGSGLYLTTEKNYADFELKLEYKHGANADSGIYLRAIPQVQIWDIAGKHGDAKKGSGGLWNNPGGSKGRDPLLVADNPVGEWNTIHIRLVGDKVTVRLNDKLVVDEAPLHNYFDKGGPLPKTGPIQLQTHGAEIHWRNVMVKEL